MYNATDIILSILAAFLVFGGISKFRIYLKTGIKGCLLIGVSFVLCSVGFILVIFYGAENIYLCAYMILAFIVYSWGSIKLMTVESGQWKEVMSKNNYIEKLTGNVKEIEKKYYDPIINKRLGIFGSILFILAAPIAYIYTGSLFFLIYLLLTGIVLYIIIRWNDKARSSNISF